MDNNLPYFQKIFVPFFDLGEISRFDSFLTVKKLSKNCQNKISPLNQKSTQRFFVNMEDYHPYLLGISSKIVGRDGKMVFFWPRSFQSLTVSFDKKELTNQNFFFPKPQY